MNRFPWFQVSPLQTVPEDELDTDLVCHWLKAFDILSILNEDLGFYNIPHLSDLGATSVVASRRISHGGVLWGRQHARRRGRVQGVNNVAKINYFQRIFSLNFQNKFCLTACRIEAETRLFGAGRAGPVWDQAAAAEEPVGTLLLERGLVRQERHLDTGTPGVANGWVEYCQVLTLTNEVIRENW